MYIRSLTVFGSYLDDEVDRLGDLDVGLDFGRRTNDPAASRRYARASGRTSTPSSTSCSGPSRNSSCT